MPPTVHVTSEPLTYHRHAPVSYFRDLLLEDREPASRDRLQRHGQEMDVIRKEREARAWRDIHAGGFEYRVEPSRTPGFGGYFAPPLWVTEWFAAGIRPGRVLGGLIPRFDLPDGVSSINLPILTQGTTTGVAQDTAGVPGTDITDSAGSSTVVTIAGQADVALQGIEQSPPGASLDWALLRDLGEDHDRSLESQLLAGRGSAFDEMTGVANVTGIHSVTYTTGSPTATGMWGSFGQAVAQIGDARERPPECWLMRTARWSWLATSEDNQDRPLGLSSPFFLGSDEATPNPVGGLVSLPVFLSDAISATQGSGANQDSILCLRPTDMVLLESQPVANIFREALSGTLGARVQLHTRVAAITSRYPSGIATIGGSGLAVQSGW